MITSSSTWYGELFSLPLLSVFLSSSLLLLALLSFLPLQVYEAAQMLSKWREEVSQLRIQYEQLLFFSIPKLLHLFRMITAEKPEINAIVQEVGFLFQNKPLVLKKLKETVQVCGGLRGECEGHWCVLAWSVVLQ